MLGVKISALCSKKKINATCAHIDRLKKGLLPKNASKGVGFLASVPGTGRCAQTNVGKTFELTQVHQMNNML